MALQSALYSGLLQHRRHQPRAHQFRYRSSLLLLDLDEQQQVFGLSQLWSGRWWSPMRFREGDYLRAERQLRHCWVLVVRLRGARQHEEQKRELHPAWPQHEQAS